MKKVKMIVYKIIVSLILIITLFNFSYINKSHAAVSSEFVNGVSNLSGGIVSILITGYKLKLVGLGYAMSTITTRLANSWGKNPDYKDYAGSEANSDNLFITPLSIFFNKYYLTDINFFEIKDNMNDDIKVLRSNVAKWFYIFRNIAAAALLVICIYVGMRMALSTIAEQEAKYKKMLIDWVVSLVLIFVMEYIIIFVIMLNEVLVKTLARAFSITGDGVSNIMLELGIKAVLPGVSSLGALLVYSALVLMTIIFLITYITRMIKVGFLIVCSPMVTITYSIDRMGDGKAQSLAAWFKEFLYTVLIQPFHCILYYTFSSVAFELINGSWFDFAEYNYIVNGCFAVICLIFIFSAEKTIRHIFNFQDDGKASFAAGIATGMVAINAIQKTGGGLRKTYNSAVKGSAKLAENLKDKNTLLGKMANSKVATSISNSSFVRMPKNVVSSVADSSKNMLGNVANMVNDTAAVQGLKTAISGVKKTAGKFYYGKDENHKGLKDILEMRKKLPLSGLKMSHAIGTYAAMYSLLSGKGPMESFAMYESSKNASQELINSSNYRIAKGESDNVRKIIEEKVEQSNEAISEANEEIDKAMSLLGSTDGFNPEALDVSGVDSKKAQIEANESLETAMKEFDAMREVPKGETPEERRASYEEYIRQLKEKANKSGKGINGLTKEEADLMKLNDTAQKMQIIACMAKISEQQEYINNAFTDENIEAEIADLRRGGSKGIMNAAKQEILADIMRAKKKKDAMNQGGRVQTVEEMDIASVADEQVELQSHIIDVLRLAAIKNSGVDFDTLIAEAGITKEDGALYEDMKKQLSTYLTEARKDEAASAYTKGRSYNASDSAMSKALKDATVSSLGRKYQGKRKGRSQPTDEELFGRK